MSNKLRSERNNQIEGLRGIAILIVVAYHLFCRYLQIFRESDNRFLHMWGTLGVGFFILISGYYLLPNEKVGDDFSFLCYLKRKIFRLWPCYFVAVTIIFLVLKFFSLPGRQSSWNDYILNVFLLNGFVGMPYVDGAHWYMTTLFSMILINAVARNLKVAVHPLFYLSWMTIALLFSALGLKQISTDIGGGYVGYLCIAFSLKSIFDEKRIFQKFFIFLCGIVGCLGICLLIGKIALIEVIIIVPVFYSCVQKKAKFLDNHFLVCIGKISYPLYLIHQNISYLIIYSLMKKNDQYFYIYGAIAFAISLLLAYILHILVEKRLGLLLKQMK